MALSPPAPSWPVTTSSIAEQAAALKKELAYMDAVLA